MYYEKELVKQFNMKLKNKEEDLLSGKGVRNN